MATIIDIGAGRSTTDKLTRPQKEEIARKNLQETREEKIARRHQIFCEVIATLEDYDLVSVADSVDMSVTTLRNWVHGAVVSPSFNNICKVAEAIGLEIALLGYKPKHSPKSPRK